MTAHPWAVRDFSPIEAICVLLEQPTSSNNWSKVWPCASKTCSWSRFADEANTFHIFYCFGTTRACLKTNWIQFSLYLWVFLGYFGTASTLDCRTHRFLSHTCNDDTKDTHLSPLFSCLSLVPTFPLSWDFMRVVVVVFLNCFFCLVNYKSSLTFFESKIPSK